MTSGLLPHPESPGVFCGCQCQWLSMQVYSWQWLGKSQSGQSCPTVYKTNSDGGFLSPYVYIFMDYSQETQKERTNVRMREKEKERESERKLEKWTRTHRDCSWARQKREARDHPRTRPSRKEKLNGRIFKKNAFTAHDPFMAQCLSGSRACSGQVLCGWVYPC